MQFRCTSPAVKAIKSMLQVISIAIICPPPLSPLPQISSNQTAKKIPSIFLWWNFCDTWHQICGYVVLWYCTGFETPCIWAIIGCSFSVVKLNWYIDRIASFDVSKLYLVCASHCLYCNKTSNQIIASWLCRLTNGFQNGVISTMSVHEMRSHTHYISTILSFRALYIVK